ncbi:MAG TPA: GNAT family N-acetyltransferase [Anaerolineaceae bacterium]|nr:GNAT family N-acetyltransferase [Anaerolineaceae bacterium]
MNIQPGTKAYLEAISYKYQVENKATIIRMDQVLGIHYPQLLVQPWPRQFSYKLEFFTGNNSPSQVKNEILKFLREEPEEHVINVISDNLTQLIPAYKAHGYLHAWSNIIMSRKLSINEKFSNPSDVEIKVIKSIQDVSLVNSIEPDYPCSTNGLDDPAILNLMVFYKGDICAKSQMMLLEKKFVYIADIFTHPDYRRRGISTALMREMQKIALQEGKTISILVPSKMTREFDLFKKLSYQPLIEFALLVPEAKIT